ncbi:hypothetical protein HPB49_022265 [Dermacentor silvarum]|uniref:Uncharacterized protein n=1 Tax=Dermacentor silvarum TaxID=543639 RepID=A0ACB8CHQ9_DERSI|nr:hypothetical protein HPB49_022265 [Dermacentor silvarum]
MPKSLSRMVVRFSVDLHKELLHSRKDKKENVTSSPFMITAALSMTFAGARENTADELLAVLRGKDEKLHENFASFMPKLSSHSHKLQFHVANRIYSDEKFPVVEEYATFVNSTYASTIQSTGNPVVSEMIHSVYLQIDEDGTDAAVATPAVAAASTTTVSPAATQKTEFVVDHPFMLLVLKSKSDVILFMSSVRHP